MSIIGVILGLAGLGMLLIDQTLGLGMIVVGALFAIVGSINQRRAKEDAKAALEERRHQELLAAACAGANIGAVNPAIATSDNTSNIVATPVATYAVPVSADPANMTPNQRDGIVSSGGGMRAPILIGLIVVVVLGAGVAIGTSNKQSDRPSPANNRPVIQSTVAPIFDPLFFHGGDNRSIGPFTLPAGHYLAHLITTGNFIATLAVTAGDRYCGMGVPSPFVVGAGEANGGIDVAFRTSGCTALFTLQTVNMPYSLAITALP